MGIIRSGRVLRFMYIFGSVRVGDPGEESWGRLVMFYLLYKWCDAICDPTAYREKFGDSLRSLFEHNKRDVAHIHTQVGVWQR